MQTEKEAPSGQRQQQRSTQQKPANQSKPRETAELRTGRRPLEARREDVRVPVGR